MEKNCQERIPLWKQSGFVRAVAAVCAVLAGTVFLVSFCRVRALAAPAEVKAWLPDYAIQNQNPLTRVTEEEAGQAVRTFYEERSRQNQGVQYENLEVYAKKGNQENTWVVFARYAMKIEDIYTPVPGLGTFYAKKEEGTLRLEDSVKTGEEQETVQVVTSHPDVQELFGETQEEYQKALQSDALLAEALSDLQKAAAR